MNNHTVTEKNYMDKVTRFFTRLRGGHMATSPKDWIIVEKWETLGIPLKIVFRGLEDAVMAHSRTRHLSLGKCDKYVQKNWESYRALNTGKNHAPEDEEPDEKVIRRLMPRLVDRVTHNLHLALKKYAPDHLESVTVKIDRTMDELLTQTSAGTITGFPEAAELMNTAHEKILNILAEIDNEKYYPYCITEKCAVPRLDLVQLFIAEDDDR